MGGTNDFDEDIKTLMIFDAAKGTFTTQQDVEWPEECFSLLSNSNQAAMVQPGKVLAFGQVDNEGTMALLSYDREINKISVEHHCGLVEDLC